MNVPGASPFIRINAPTPVRLARFLLVAAAVSVVFSLPTMLRSDYALVRLLVALPLLLFAWVPAQKVLSVSPTRMTMRSWLDIPTGNIGFERDLSAVSFVELGRDGKWRLLGPQRMGIPVARWNEAEFLTACRRAGVRVVGVERSRSRTTVLRRIAALLGGIALLVAAALAGGSIIAEESAFVCLVVSLRLIEQGYPGKPLPLVNDEAPSRRIDSRPDAG